MKFHKDGYTDLRGRFDYATVSTRSRTVGGRKACVDNLRRKFPKARIVLVKILPVHEPGNAFYENIKKTNAELDPLKLDADKLVRVLDLTADVVNADRTIKAELYKKDKIHLSEAGYVVYAEKIQRVVDAVLADARKLSVVWRTMLCSGLRLQTPSGLRRC